MRIEKTFLEGVLLIEPQVFKDDRGYFFESYHKEKFHRAGITEDMIQDNQSCSGKGAVRGLHFQAPPFAQGKLVRVSGGRVIDVVVDIRKNSPTYGQHLAVELSAANNLMLWIPPGFAHGFETMEDDTIFLYKCSNVYDKQSEGGVLWNDPDLQINWQTTNPLVSEKDSILPRLKDLVSPF